ncbi:PorT family protein [Hymenobacter sp. BT683]|uniref:PorT family protein n=1 Tax=Hymenobacter jeongseonensis TaxID=2791027 RepID=A0ABS0IND6_9BACT|nr:porin family protein [Hymenobacter jeongseonensis]MBF9239881.1 PorT family protein [Hymenobacter jeongseonensis]
MTSPLTPAVLLLSGLLFAAPQLHAQPSFSLGPRVGLNAATSHAASGPDDGSVRYRPGGEAGLTGSLRFGRFAVQPALLYSQKGYAYHARIDYRDGTGFGTADYDDRVRLDYLTLPVSLAYGRRADGQGVQVFAGPYLALLLGGRYATTIAVPSNPQTARGNISVAKEPGTGRVFQRYDAGLQAGLGYRRQALLFQAGYSLGLRAATSFGDHPPRYAYNRTFQASLSYLFARQAQ